MSYNNGKSLDINEISDIEIAIKEFSEDNVYLEKLLLYCYKNNFKTVACCAGHKENESFPYISFAYSKENEQLIYYLLSNFKDSNILFTYNKHSVSGSYFSIEFRNYDYKCFKEIIDVLSSFNRTKNYYYELPNDLQNYFNIINSIENSNLLQNENNVYPNYFQIHYLKDDDLYNYLVFSNNYNCVQLLKESDFKLNNEDVFQFYYAESKIRDENNEILEKMSNNLNQLLSKTNNIKK